MLCPDESRLLASDLTLEDFVPDPPTPREPIEPPRTELQDSTPIDGVTTSALSLRHDRRGWLSELLTTREGEIEPIVHVYRVRAAPGSIRAWVYHLHQFDRLAYANGDFQVVLYDLRPESPTRGRLNVFRIGDARPCLLRIPPRVVHGVRNVGSDWASFINMPTQVYFHDTPDKCRIPYGDPRMPYVFE